MLDSDRLKIFIIISFASLSLLRLPNLAGVTGASSGISESVMSPRTGSLWLAMTPSEERDFLRRDLLSPPVSWWCCDPEL